MAPWVDYAQKTKAVQVANQRKPGIQTNRRWQPLRREGLHLANGLQHGCDDCWLGDTKARTRARARAPYLTHEVPDGRSDDHLVTPFIEQLKESNDSCRLG